MRKNILIHAKTAIYKDKGSKFLAYAWQVKNEDDIRNSLDQLKKEHFSARHWCYAWRLGETGESYRSNDDGEPAGSAGRPILATIDALGLSDVLVVVVRYFGGTLLGVRGLINAYGGAAELALSTAEIAPMPIPRVLDVSMGFEQLAEVQKVVNEIHLKPATVNYGNLIVKMHFEADIDRIKQLASRLRSIYGVDLTEDADEIAEN